MVTTTLMRPGINKQSPESMDDAMQITTQSSFIRVLFKKQNKKSKLGSKYRKQKK